MKLSLIVLLAATAGGCAKNHPSPPAHASTERASPESRARSESTPDEGRASESASGAESAELADARRHDPSEDTASTEGRIRSSEAGNEPSAAALAAETGATASADNTAINKADRNGDTLTPLDQGESAADRETTQGIRKEVVAAASLSFTAKNIKIMTRDGRVTLRGPVKSAKERDAIAEIANRIAGSTRVDNQLQVASNN